jgi:predicted O-methyltransferase YrrM
MSVERVLRSILDTGLVTNGEETFKLHSAISEEEGRFIQENISRFEPRIYLEVGLAFGISTLYAGDSLGRTGQSYSHHIVDPQQHTAWNGVGIYNLKQAGLWDNISFYEAPSEYVLPQLAEGGTEVDMAFIDGWHTFDHTLLDFFYVNRMLKVGGVVIFDDADWPSVSKVLKYVTRYPCYQLCGEMQQSPVTALAKGVMSMRVPNLKPNAVAIRKVSADERRWDWFEPF